MAARRRSFPSILRRGLTCIVGVVLVAACGEIGGPAPGEDSVEPAVSSVEVSAAGTTIPVGEAVDVTADVVSEGGASEAVTWTSSAPAIASLAVSPDDGHRATVTGEAVGANVVITATSDVDAAVSGSVVIEVVADPGLSLTTLRSEIVPEGFVRMTWDVNAATAIDVYAVDTDLDDVILLEEGLAGDTEAVTFAIPDSAHQTIRVVASDGGDERIESWILRNVVTNPGDYDPYDAVGWVAGDEATPVPGTLRYVLDRAPAGSVVGFASDVTAVNLFGVRFDAPNDAHLIVNQDVTISGPAFDPVTGEPIAIRQVEHPAVGDADPLTFRSRMMLVGEGVAVTLQNLRISGGAFIFDGAGIRNRGTLTLDTVDVSGNAAWDRGGGIFNDGGTLTLIDSDVSENVAATEAVDMNRTFLIRGMETYPVDVTDGGYGGAIYSDEAGDGSGGVVYASGSTFEANEAKFVGGALYNGSDATLSDCSVIDSFAVPVRHGGLDTDHNAGGGIYSDGTLLVTGGEVSHNTADYYGGGLFLLAAGSAELDSVTFTYDAAEFGGAIYHQTYASDAGINLDYDAATELAFFMNSALDADHGHDVYVETIADETDALGALLSPASQADDDLRGRDR